MRLAYLDSARAVLMLLGIPYHAALIFHIHQWMLIHDAAPSYGLSYLAEFLHLFRMPAFFIIAGYFSFLTLSKVEYSGGVWLRKRAVRIFLPLISGIVLILPVQAVIASYPGPIHGSNLSHLWFLAGLVVYSIVLAGTWRIWKFLAGQWVTPFLVAILTAALQVSVATYETKYGFLPLSMGLILQHAPYFFVGVMFRANKTAWDSATEARWPLMILSLGVAFAYPIFELSGPTLPVVCAVVIDDISIALSTYAILAIFRRFLDRPSKLVSIFVPAAFSIYLFHHPIIIALGRFGEHIEGPPVIKWVVIVMLAAGLSYAVHRLIHRYPLLRLLLNGEMPVQDRERIAAAPTDNSLNSEAAANG